MGSGNVGQMPFAVLHAGTQVDSWRGGRRGLARVVVAVAARARAVRRVEGCVVLVVWFGLEEMENGEESLESKRSKLLSRDLERSS